MIWVFFGKFDLSGKSSTAFKWCVLITLKVFGSTVPDYIVFCSVHFYVLLSMMCNDYLTCFLSLQHQTLKAHTICCTSKRDGGREREGEGGGGMWHVFVITLVYLVSFVCLFMWIMQCIVVIGNEGNDFSKYMDLWLVD